MTSNRREANNQNLKFKCCVNEYIGRLATAEVVANGPLLILTLRGVQEMILLGCDHFCFNI